MRIASMLPTAAGIGIAGTLTLCAGPLPAAVSIGRVACAQSSGVHHAALVVEHGNGSVVTHCVGFDSESVTGEGLLEMSGIPYQKVAYGSMGDAVCQIDGEHASSYPPTCFDSSYWAVLVARSGGPWGTSGLGISSLTLRDGDAEGFRFSSASAPLPTPRGVCPPPAADRGPGTAAPPQATATPATAVVPAAVPPGRSGPPRPGAPATVSAPSAPARPAAAAPATAVTGAAPTATAPPVALDRAPAPPPGKETGSPPSGPGARVDLGWLLAGVAGGGLLGLLGAQLLLGRGRATA